MGEVKVSLFASAVRPKLWPALITSIKDTSVDTEVVFCGHSTDTEILPILKLCKNIGFKNFLHIPTETRQYVPVRIKPAQCYEIARRDCKGEVVVWIADDMEFPNDIIGKAYNYWKSKNNKKLILSLQTKESGYGCKDGKLFPMKEHTFYSLMPDTPLMAPVAMLSREFLNELGGFDRRFVCGQYENSTVMQAYQAGANVEIFGDESCYVDIDHLGKSIAIGESVDEESFRERPFSKGYETDRKVLEASWTTFDQSEAFRILQRGDRPFSLRKVSPVQLDKFEGYEDKDIRIKSQSNKGHWE